MSISIGWVSPQDQHHHPRDHYHYQHSDHDRTSILIMIGRYLKGVSGRTSHIDHSDALRALTRTLIKMIIMMIINRHHNRSSKSSTLS